MINNVNSTPSFGSTFIPHKKIAFYKYFGDLPKHFSIKGREMQTVQNAADSITHGQAAVMSNKNGLTIVGKDGGIYGEDQLIYKIIKKLHPDAQYTDDIKHAEFKKSIIDLNI